MVLHVTLLNTRHYKVGIKGKVEQSWERSSAPHLGVGVHETGVFESPTFTYIYISACEFKSHSPPPVILCHLKEF